MSGPLGQRGEQRRARDPDGLRRARPREHRLRREDALFVRIDAREGKSLVGHAPRADAVRGPDGVGPSLAAAVHEVEVRLRDFELVRCLPPLERDDLVEAAAFEFDGRGQARGPAADHDRVDLFDRRLPEAREVVPRGGP